MSRQQSPNVRALLEARAGETPHGVYCISPETGREMTFGGLLDSARSLAALLAARGVEPGAHVAMLLPNGLQAVRIFVGAMAGGHVITPLSLLARPAQLAYVLEHSGCRAVFVAPELVERLGEALSMLPDGGASIEVLAADPDELRIADEPAVSNFPSGAPDADAPALLMYTSGTTGRPKGVLLTHENVLAGARFVSEAHRLGPDDRVLAVLPLYHINAQIMTVLAPLYHGGSLAMPRRFSTSAFWPLAIAQRCTWINVVPTIIAYLLEDPAGAKGLDLSRIRFCRSASAPLPPEHQRAFEERFGIGVIETMGLTETAGPCLANPPEPLLRKYGSPGRAFGNEAKVVDPATGRDLPDGLPGEIVVRGPNVMRGYYQGGEESALAFLPDGWLRTGDLGYRDADGFFFITGRLKEIIIKGGENIAPREIDEVLLAHPGVLEAAAVGIPDTFYGQDILAGVVLKPGSGCGEADLKAHCERHLGRFKTPRVFRLLAELPKGPSGKIQRLKLLDA
ncbi:AMP-binding protein [Azoarcus sp. KH32C]|uniref:AMP-binding protein n=1 Tax=Azoarcus sp. KH32C TaxID=748247 RepID=UPI0002386C9D|nr:AMP-binding protein [Azoarcus sp. KH32C]BAL24920.1 long-chain acyl-CoA synthetase [Azoarcus sp. KH32C]